MSEVHLRILRLLTGNMWLSFHRHCHHIRSDQRSVVNDRDITRLKHGIYQVDHWCISYSIVTTSILFLTRMLGLFLGNLKIHGLDSFFVVAAFGIFSPNSNIGLRCTRHPHESRWTEDILFKAPNILSLMYRYLHGSVTCEGNISNYKISSAHGRVQTSLHQLIQIMT